MNNLIPETDRGHLASAAINIYQATCHMVEKTENEQRPSFMLRDQIKMSVDGDQWCVLFGENLQDGVAGFGKSPEKAMRDFDKNWHKEMD